MSMIEAQLRGIKAMGLLLDRDPLRDSVRPLEAILGLSAKAFFGSARDDFTPQNAKIEGV
jgi:hypothetical protein